jgi:hypothetical protein
MPFGAEKPDESWIAQATVTHAIGFRARTEIPWRSVARDIPPEVAVAFITTKLISNKNTQKWTAYAPK